ASEASSPELTCEPEPARTATSTRRRRLLLYALAAAGIVVAAALVDHWGVLPRVGANPGSSTTQVGAPPHRWQLLPPLGQPPIMHFSNAADATSAPAESSAQPASPAAGPSGVQNQEARPARSTASAKQPAVRDGGEFRRQAGHHCPERMSLMRTRATATWGTAVPVRAEHARTLR